MVSVADKQDNLWKAIGRNRRRKVIIPLGLFMSAWALMLLVGVYHSMVPQFSTIGFWHAVLLCVIPWTMGYWGAFTWSLPVPFTNKQRS